MNLKGSLLLILLLIIVAGCGNDYKRPAVGAFSDVLVVVLNDNDRWIWVWWQDGVDDIEHITSDWINAKRDSLQMQYIRGSREVSYVSTSYTRPLETRPITLNGYKAFETRGICVYPFLKETLYYRMGLAVHDHACQG